MFDSVTASIRKHRHNHFSSSRSLPFRPRKENKATDCFLPQAKAEAECNLSPSFQRRGWSGELLCFYVTKWTRCSAPTLTSLMLCCLREVVLKCGEKDDHRALDDVRRNVEGRDQTYCRVVHARFTDLCAAGQQHQSCLSGFQLDGLTPRIVRLPRRVAQFDADHQSVAAHLDDSESSNIGLQSRFDRRARLCRPLDETVDAILAAALALEAGNRSRAARRLGVSLRTMQRFAARGARRTGAVRRR